MALTNRGTMSWRGRAWTTALLVLLGAALPARAQTLSDSVAGPRGRCGLWVLPVGGSTFPRDASYARCALDQQPKLSANASMPITPALKDAGGASYRVIVSANGTVDPELTRTMSVFGGWRSMDQSIDFSDEVLAVVRKWRFTPGARAGRAVRSAFDLELRVNARASDTLPAHVAWRYIAGDERDTLAGEWITDGPLPPFPARVEDSLYVALLRELMAMGVVQPTAARHYCLVPGDSVLQQIKDSGARWERVARALRPRIDSRTRKRCADAPDLVRLELPRLHRLEEGRVMLDVRAMQLPRWPFDFESRAWERWHARCLGASRAGASATMTCSVEPITSQSELASWYAEQDRRPTTRRGNEGDTVTVTVLARSTNAFGIDTLRAKIASIPRLAERAIRDTAPICDSWSVWAPGDSETFVVYGDLADLSLRVTRANPTAAPNEALPTGMCSRPEGRAPHLTAFFLGGLGRRPRAPVTLCLSTCGRRYVLDPAQHTIAEHPHVRFSAASLRNRPTRERDQLNFRVLVDPDFEGVVPVVIVREGERDPVTAHLMRDLGGGTWDWPVHIIGSWAQREVLIYLIRP